MPPATAVDADSDGVGDADAVGDDEVDTLADGDAEADPVGDDVADPDGVLAAEVWAVAEGREVVGVRVGRGLGDGDDGSGAGAVPGGSPPPSCHENATVAPVGTVSEPTAELAYFQPDVPSDQYSPQYASAGEVFTHGSLVGTPSTRQTNPGCRCA